MANQEHVNMLKKSVDEWNRWKKAHQDIQPDLSRADLGGHGRWIPARWMDNLIDDDFNRANLRDADLSGADLTGVSLLAADLSGADLSGADLSDAYLWGANLNKAKLRQAKLIKADLSFANLSGARLSGARLSGAKLRGANLSEANLAGINLSNIDLRRANLSRIDFSNTPLVDEQGVGPSIVDTFWTETILSVIDWSAITQLGDEKEAHTEVNDQGNRKSTGTRSGEYKNAARATSQLAVILQDQGILYASHFIYKSKCLERMALYYSMRNVKWNDQKSGNKTLQSVRKGILEFISILFPLLFSWFLFIIAGYGYRLRFCLSWYFALVFGFACAYLFLEPHYFTWWTALGESVNVFHGRGASPSVSSLAHPARFAILTVLEAWNGLVIEVIFVATLLQRFFGK